MSPRTSDASGEYLIGKPALFNTSTIPMMIGIITKLIKLVH